MTRTQTCGIRGQQVSVPCVVRDASSGSAMCMVDRSAAQMLCADAFEPIEAAPGSLGLLEAPALLSAWTEHMRGSFGPSTKL